MGVLRVFQDYVNAVRYSSPHFIAAPITVPRVLLARLRYQLGPRFYSLYGLSDVPIGSWSEFLGNEEFRKRLRKINSAEAREVVNDKILFFEHCRANALPTIPILCSIRSAPSGAVGDRLQVDLVGWEKMQATLPSRIFAKLIDGSWGVDAFVAERVGGNWLYCGISGGAREFFDFAVRRLRGRVGWIVQPAIRAHSRLLDVMSSNALGTLRMVSVLSHGVPQVVFSVLRIPVGKNCVDNFSHGTSGNLIASVDPSSGRLIAAFGSLSADWPVMAKVEAHPETGVRFENFVLPQWSEANEIVKAAHRSLPHLKTLGWDIAITDDGPIIVEANGSYDIDILQAAFRRGIRRDLLLDQIAH